MASDYRSIPSSPIGDASACVFCRKGQLDVRELISLYPLLLPASSTFTRCHPPLHEFADLNHLAQGDQDKVLRCKKFLISYVTEVGASWTSSPFKLSSGNHAFGSNSVFLWGFV